MMEKMEKMEKMEMMEQMEMMEMMERDALHNSDVHLKLHQSPSGRCNNSNRRINPTNDFLHFLKAWKPKEEKNPDQLGRQCCTGRGCCCCCCLAENNLSPNFPSSFLISSNL